MMARWLRRIRSDEGGVSLAEVLVAMTIFSLSVVAILGSLGAMAKASDVARRKATTAAVGAISAERLSALLSYTSCATPSTYQSQLPAPPTGFTTTVSSVKYWNGSINPAGFTATCTSDTGVQQITLTSTSPGSNWTDTAVFTKRKP